MTPFHSVRSSLHSPFVRWPSAAGSVRSITWLIWLGLGVTRVGTRSITWLICVARASERRVQ